MTWVFFQWHFIGCGWQCLQQPSPPPLGHSRHLPSLQSFTSVPIIKGSSHHTWQKLPRGWFFRAILDYWGLLLGFPSKNPGGGVSSSYRGARWCKHLCFQLGWQQSAWGRTQRHARATELGSACPTWVCPSFLEPGTHQSPAACVGLCCVSLAATHSLTHTIVTQTASQAFPRVFFFICWKHSLTFPDTFTFFAISGKHLFMWSFSPKLFSITHSDRVSFCVMGFITPLISKPQLCLSGPSEAWMWCPYAPDGGGGDTRAVMFCPHCHETEPSTVGDMRLLSA